MTGTSGISASLPAPASPIPVPALLEDAPLVPLVPPAPAPLLALPALPLVASPAEPVASEPPLELPALAAGELSDCAPQPTSSATHNEPAHQTTERDLSIRVPERSSRG